MEQDVFQAIADPTRRKLLELLADQELSIAAMTQHFSLSRTAINKHLAVLAEAGLVSSKKVGRETKYRLIAEPLAEMKDWVTFFEKYWSKHLLVLKQLVETDTTS
ncbi:metalloregulator ArsR/SmtB family transcription factor [Paenibacillus sp. N1-5-1-14]|uniref:ArsR/SmtB family transcription factor n=1 Tax=Paenibacillus radicibacter TaxID=2972488 RepID=UPI002159239E|nr:metalloregulator ArsR/SmtB family transcription factor [Paenibacillus radicibacter]MCR8642874.1 metalloregulator ArsR/SmtB family transcription factor [Paenibacillus radicibacter]